MLLTILCVASVALAAGLCCGNDLFGSLAWLWALPVSLIGSFLVLLALVFGVLVLICSRIDPEKPREKDSPWFRWLVMEVVHVIVTLLPVRVRIQGKEKIPTDGRFLLVSNHIHNIDPALLFYCFPKSQLAFVGKKETGNMFLIGKIMPKLLCPSINRENDREALKTILRCIQLLKNDTVSIAVFPEGRINSYRKLAHFRPGAFKIAQKANVPIVVCTLQGTNHVLSQSKKLKRSEVEVHVLGVIPAEQLQDQNTVQIAERVYAMMAQDLGPENVLTEQEEENT